MNDFLFNFTESEFSRHWWLWISEVCANVINHEAKAEQCYSLSSQQQSSQTEWHFKLHSSSHFFLDFSVTFAAI